VSLCRIGTPREDVKESSTVNETRLQTKIVDFKLRLLLLRRVTVVCQLRRRLGKPKGDVELWRRKMQNVDENYVGQKLGWKWILFSFE
jgi:hypothetical protein